AMLARPAVSQIQNARGTFSGTYGGGMMRGASTNGGLLSGTIEAKDATSLTLNTRDGSSHVVLITPATNVSKSVSGATSDITVGSTVTVSGTANSDGSVSATLVQLRPTTPKTPAQ
ncbi:MAG: DUF5666 domain-containing protein, partial [Candidatus Kaiserbacteria bacterium]|nr:DUF5666 domain-containing protein [Candidatus Kaiserbacteria bacterium]